MAIIPLIGFYKLWVRILQKIVSLVLLVDVTKALITTVRT